MYDGDMLGIGNVGERHNTFRYGNDGGLGPYVVTARGAPGTGAAASSSAAATPTASTVLIDAACNRSIMSMVNHPPAGRLPNLVLVDVVDQNDPTRIRSVMQALRPIRHGEELYFDYGEEYWASASSAHESPPTPPADYRVQYVRENVRTPRAAAAEAEAKRKEWHVDNVYLAFLAVLSPHMRNIYDGLQADISTSPVCRVITDVCMNVEYCDTWKSGLMVLRDYLKPKTQTKKTRKKHAARTKTLYAFVNLLRWMVYHWISCPELNVFYRQNQELALVTQLARALTPDGTTALQDTTTASSTPAATQWVYSASLASLYDDHSSSAASVPPQHHDMVRAGMLRREYTGDRVEAVVRDESDVLQKRAQELPLQLDRTTPWDKNDRWPSQDERQQWRQYWWNDVLKRTCNVELAHGDVQMTPAQQERVTRCAHGLRGETVELAILAEIFNVNVAVHSRGTSSEQFIGYPRDELRKFTQRDCDQSVEESHAPLATVHLLSHGGVVHPLTTASSPTQFQKTLLSRTQTHAPEHWQRITPMQEGAPVPNIDSATRLLSQVPRRERRHVQENVARCIQAEKRLRHDDAE